MAAFARGRYFWGDREAPPTPCHSELSPVRDSISTFAIISASGAIRHPTQTKGNQNDKRNENNRARDYHGGCVRRDCVRAFRRLCFGGGITNKAKEIKQ